MVDSNNAAAAAASNAVQGLVSALQDITQELNSAQGQLSYWKVEADAWKTRFEQERARNVRLRRVLRAHGSPQPMAATLSAHPSLVVSPRAGRGPSGTGDSLHLWRTLSATTAPAADAGAASSTSTAAVGDASLPPTQHLRPLKCVAEEACTPAAGQQLSTLVQPGSAHTPLAWLSASSTEGTPLSAVAAAAAATAGASSSLHDPFRSVQQHSLVTMSDSGAPACSLQQQEQQNGDANCSGSTTRSNSRLATASAAEAPAAAAAAGGSAPAAEAADAPLPTVASFRRSHTLPVTSSFTFARSPRFAGGSSGSFLLTPAGTWLPPSGSRHTVDQLLRVMMAFTLMQGAGSSDGTDDAPGGDSQGDEDALPSVSLDDDDGSSGVGLAAAAAVSAAMARAWASAASNEQRAVAAAAAAATGSNGSSKLGSKEGGGSSSGRAGFRLVATVTNKMGKRPASTSALSSYASQDSLDANTMDITSVAPASHNASKDSSRPGSSGSLSRLISPSPIASAAAAAVAAAAGGVSGVGNTSSGSGLPPPSPGSPALASAAGSPAPAGAAARSAAAVPAVGGAPNTGQATTISLQWLSRPRTVLVMRKLAPTTESAFLRALDWLRRHRVTMFVEPKVFQELVDSGRVVPVPEPQQQQLGGGSAAAGAGASGSSRLALPSSSSGSLCGMLVSTAQHAPSAAPGALLPSISWPGPSLSSSGGGGGAGSSSNAPADKAAAGGMPPASPPSAAAAGGASAATANIKTWQPELHITQQQQQQAAAEGGDCGCQVSVSDLIPDAVAQQLDLVVVLGGDGTVLWTCHIFGNRSVPPLVPFNLGSLGFLTPFDPARLEQVLLKAFRGGFPITLRHRLHCTIVRCSGSTAAAAPPAPPQQPGGDDTGLPCVSRSCVGHCVYGEEHVSLNEVVIERGISPFLTNLECFCDGTFVTHVQGDGLIVGTPTGSTAYSLAAGGSMVHPQVPCILFTPICPHSLSFRPLMFPDYVQLCVQVPADARGHVWASFDGKDRTELGPGDAVVIRLSKWPIPSVAAEADPSSDWFNAVRECLHWNLRKVQGGAGM